MTSPSALDSDSAMDANFASTTDSVEVDGSSNNDLNGEQCGICMDVVIDRGVLDCCPHWFCFGCIDNWATITNLCPLCQNEFQLITCVPVYDTIGSNKVDEDSYSRDDDWVIEGKNNTLSFPSYYIDENAVICLDGDGCQIRNGSASAEGDSTVDTSIACDSCDIWYHAFCVGFDPESTSEEMWLCPRCVAEEMSQPPDGNLIGNTIKEQLTEDAYSKKVSVCVADSGETALVVSMVGDYVLTEEPHDNNPSTVEIGNDLKTQTFTLTSEDSGQKVTTQAEDKSVITPTFKTRELELSLSSDTSCSVSSHVLVKKELMTSDMSVNDSLDQSSEMGLHLGLSIGSVMSVNEVNGDAIENQTKGVRLEDPVGECLPRAYEPDGNANGDASEDVSGIVGLKRKKLDSRVDSKTDDLDQVSPKKTRADKANFSALDVPNDLKETIPNSKRLKRQVPEKKSGASDIMSIVQGKNRRHSKGINRLNTDDKSTTELEKVTGVRVKKIMKRVDKDNESSVVVQKLRSEIRDAVRNKSVKDSGENLFDPKLLEAFRAAVSGPKPDSVKTQSQLSVRAKKLMLQKGNVREKLTKKIYALNGRRKRAWNRECEVEFWKSRCMRASRPEKIQTLNSVLDLLRNGRSESTETGPTDPILSRLYLADTSVFPRKEDIKPLAILKSSTDLAETCSKPSLDNLNSRVSDKDPVKGLKINSVTSSSKVNSSKSIANPKYSTCKEASAKPDDVRSDKRKWALEVLARRASGTGGGAANENQGETSALKGNYPLLAQLPVEMRPVLAQSRHNKIPMAVRQAQLYRRTEHLLRKENLPIIRRTAETELAVADAVNIERDVADRSNSKPVYLNLCSQVLLHSSERTNSSEEDPETIRPVERSEQSENDILDDPRVQEALRNAGFLSDSPPSSPNDTPEKPEEENENIFEIDNAPDLDIYGEFEYSLDDEDYIGLTAAKVSRVQPEKGASKMKLVFSTLQYEKPESSDKDNEITIETKNDLGFCKTGDDYAPKESLYGEEGEDPSVAECEELYGPDKEPLTMKLPYNSEAIPDQAEKSVSLGHNSSAGECSPNRSEAGETAQNKGKKPKVNDTKQSDNTISKKVEAYIKEHIRPLCKSGVITAAQYRWAVAKTTEKVMKYHSKAKNANFLIKEGDKVKKLAEQYVEAANGKE